MLASSMLRHCRPRSKMSALNNNISNYQSYRSFNSSFNVFRLQLDLHGGKFHRHNSTSSQDDDDDIASDDNEGKTAESSSSTEMLQLPDVMNTLLQSLSSFDEVIFRYIYNQSITHIAVYAAAAAAAAAAVISYHPSYALDSCYLH